MKDRLAKFLKNEGLSSSRFAEIMGIPPSNVSHLLAGRNNPGFEFISKMILRFPKVSPDWLLTGNGPIYRADNDQMENLKQEAVAQSKVNEGNTQELFACDAPIKDAAKYEVAESETPVVKTSHESAVTQPAIKSPNRDMTFQVKKIERIIIFYDDHTFKNFNPSPEI